MRYSNRKADYERYEGDEQLLPELPKVGWMHVVRGATRGFGTMRSNLAVYEIYYVVEGELRLRTATKRLQARPGEVFIIRPRECFAGVVSGTASVIEPCTVYWMQFLPNAEACPWSSTQEAKGLVSELAGMQRKIFPISPATAEYVEKLIDEHRNQRPHSALVARLTLNLLLVSLIRSAREVMSASGGAHRQKSKPVQRVIDWLEDQPPGRVFVEQMARVAKLSVSQLYTDFRRDLRTTPADYVLRWRMHMAENMLAKSNLSVTEIAMRLGFSSSQHFATVFKRFVSLSPTAYRHRWWQL